MHRIVEWEAARSGAGVTVTMTDAGNVRHKQLVKKIVHKGGKTVAYGGDGARFPLSADEPDTSPEVASIAGRLLAAPIVDDATCDALIDSLARSNGRDQAHAAIRNELSVLRDEVQQIAASALGQRA